jgi:ketosteroid isomerase-like protein
MKRAFTLLLAVLATGSLVYGQTKNDKNARDAKSIAELRKLVQAWDQADVSGDSTVLDRLLADEFSFVGGDNKAQYLASLKSRQSDSTVELAVSTDVQVQIYGSTAIVTGLDTIKGKNKGESYTTRWLYMDVWVKRSGRWQCVRTYSSPANKK